MSPHRAAYRWRWVGAIVIMLIGALLAGVSVVAVYARDQVLDTSTFVSTMTPLLADPVVKDAIAQRLANEIVNVAKLDDLATSAVNALESRGVPSRLSDFVGAIVASIRTFLFDRIRRLLDSPRLQAAWRRILTFAHQRLVAILTGGQVGALRTGEDTISVDIGVLLSVVKGALVDAGLTFVSKVPDVSIPYTLIESDKLPKIRGYAKVLNTLGSWLPYVALVVILAGILAAPRRRRAIITVALMTGVIAVVLLAAVVAGRHYYLDHLPPAIQSPDAAATVMDTVLRYLIQALQTLVVAALIVGVVAFLAGPARLATGVRRLMNICLAGTARGLAYLGSWTRTVGAWIGRFRAPIQIVLVLLAAVLYIIAVRPSIGSVLWGVLILGVVLGSVEVFIRTAHPTPTADPAPAG